MHFEGVCNFNNVTLLVPAAGWVAKRVLLQTHKPRHYGQQFSISIAVYSCLSTSRLRFAGIPESNLSTTRVCFKAVGSSLEHQFQEAARSLHVARTASIADRCVGAGGLCNPVTQPSKCNSRALTEEFYASPKITSVTDISCSGYPSHMSKTLQRLQ